MDSIAQEARIPKRAKPLIYVFKDVANKALKIGFSIDIDQRTKQHSTANPFLKLIAAIPVTEQSVEAKLHRALRPYRMPNTAEWYSDTHSLRDRLHQFFVDEGALTENNWDLICLYPPDSKENDFLYVDLPLFYTQQLKLTAWMTNRSMAEEMKKILTDGVERNLKDTNRMLADYARRMGISLQELEKGIFDGTIENK